MPEVHEEVINVKLAEILSKEFGIDARSERQKGRLRPDIRCYYKGFKVGIEASYNKQDAEKDAKARIEQGLVDVSIALWIKKAYHDVPENYLYKLIKESKFDVRIFVAKEIENTILAYIMKTKKISQSVSGWFTELDIPKIKDVIDASIEFLIGRYEIDKYVNEIKEKINDFIKALNDLDKDNKIKSKVHDVLYKLYGFSITGSGDPNILFGQAALSIILSSAFYEHIRSRHYNLEPLSKYINKSGIEGLIHALNDLLKIDYKNVITMTIEILNSLPPAIAHNVRELVQLGIDIAQNQGLLGKDFAGRIYHEITGDLAYRKGFATFYTSIPAAELLALLAVKELFGLSRNLTKLSNEETKKILEKIENIKVGDFACGSGTLLTASYNSLDRLLNVLKFYYDLDYNEETIKKNIIEEGIYGIDALRYASQIAAINLSLIGPGNISKTNIYTIYLGNIPNKGAWLGSLELLYDPKRIGGLWAYIEGGITGAVEKTSLEGSEGTFSIPDGFDIVIMNPPFTRATGRTKQFEDANLEKGLFGFITDEKTRKILIKRLNTLRDSVKKNLLNIANDTKAILPKEIQVILDDKDYEPYLNIGQAGEGFLFLYLAYKYVKLGGVIAFVLPRNLLAGVSWFLNRVLLASKFQLKYVIVSSDSKEGYNFSESTSLSEVLIVAKRVNDHNEFEETVFINLLNKPKSSLESMILADHIDNEEGIIKISESNAAIVSKINRHELIKNLDNWNRFVAIPETELLKEIMDLINNGELKIGKKDIKIPLIKLNDIIQTIGIDRHQFHDLFKVVNIETIRPIIYSGKKEIRKKMIIEPNAYADLKDKKGDEIFSSFSGRILLPDRIAWDTSNIIAIYSNKPVLANLFYAIRLKQIKNIELEKLEKAITLWLNTTWGMLIVLVNREETGKAWTSLKMSQWRLLPIIDIYKLNKDIIERLADLFDRVSNKTLKEIPEQFNFKNIDPVRLEIDKGFLKALDQSLNETDIENYLNKLYSKIDIAFKRMWG